MENTTYDITISRRAKAIIVGLNPKAQPLPMPTSPKVKDDFKVGLGDVAYWGTDNLFPQNIYHKAKDNSIVSSTIQKKVELLIAGGFHIGIMQEDENGEEVFKPKHNKEIATFLKSINFSTYLAEAASDFYWFQNVFPEIVRDEKSGKIIAVSAQEAMFCRFSKQDEKGIIKNCFISANWDNYDNENSVYTQTRAVIDRYYNPVLDLRLRTGTHFIYPISFPSPGTTFYQRAPWTSVTENGWLDFANRIAIFKQARLENLFTADYIVKIEQGYWEVKYPGWSKLTKEERDDRQTQTKLDIENKIAGAANAGKTIFLPTLWDAHMKAEREYVKIDIIPRTWKEDTMIDDSQEASSHLLYALGVPASLIGNTPGKGGMGAGSGADVREHLNLHLYLCGLHEQIILEPFNNLVLPYNGWGDYQIRLKKPVFQTLDQIPPDQRSNQKTTSNN